MIDYVAQVIHDFMEENSSLINICEPVWTRLLTGESSHPTSRDHEQLDISQDMWQGIHRSPLCTVKQGLFWDLTEHLCEVVISVWRDPHQFWAVFLPRDLVREDCSVSISLFSLSSSGLFKIFTVNLIFILLLKVVENITSVMKMLHK